MPNSKEVYNEYKNVEEAIVKIKTSKQWFDLASIVKVSDLKNLTFESSSSSSNSDSSSSNSSSERKVRPKRTPKPALNSDFVYSKKTYDRMTKDQETVKRKESYFSSSSSSKSFGERVG